MIEIPVFKELSFDEEKHIYKIEGQCLPSVTTVMKPMSSSYYKGIDEDVLNKAANRGTAIHNAIENYIKFAITDIPPEFEGYFKAFKKWWKEVKPEVIATECRMYHKFLRYAGTADMPCVINGKVICVDFKASATINRALTGVQLEAYSKAYESHGFFFDGKAIVHLKSDGTYTMMMYEKNDSESWEVFGALMVVHNHLQKYKWR